MADSLKQTVTIEVPADIAIALGPDGEAAANLRLLAAVKLYELNRLSSGAAARFAGIPKTLFLVRLADFGVPTFQESDADFELETTLA